MTSSCPITLVANGLADIQHGTAKVRSVREPVIDALVDQWQL